jgi:hypothetical protein
MPSLAELTKKVDRIPEEKRWQAHSDAHAIAQAAEAKMDKARLKRAKLVADQVAAAAAEKAKLVK